MIPGTESVPRGLTCQSKQYTRNLEQTGDILQLVIQILLVISLRAALSPFPLLFPLDPFPPEIVLDRLRVGTTLRENFPSRLPGHSPHIAARPIAIGFHHPFLLA